jgi:hypothetical protein
VVRGLVRAGLGLGARTGAGAGAGNTRVSEPPAVTPEVTAVALVLHGRLLADARLAGADQGAAAVGAEELLVASSHPHELIRRGANRGFDELLRRLAEHADAGAAIRLLQELGAAGLDPRLVAYQAARSALFPGADPAAAEALVHELDAAVGAASDGLRDAGVDRSDLWAYRAGAAACVRRPRRRPTARRVACHGAGGARPRRVAGAAPRPLGGWRTT